jgi:hypothetical protein
VKAASWKPAAGFTAALPSWQSPLLLTVLVGLVGQETQYWPTIGAYLFP